MARTTLSEAAYQQIKQDIISSALAPGQQIPQAELAERYKVGMTPIREAIKRLAQEQLVQYLPQVGYMVSPITVEDIRENYELRALQESAAAHWACQRASQSELDAIASTADFTYDFADESSFVPYVARDKEFHLSIAAASHNRRLVEFLSQLIDESQRIVLLGLRVRDMAQERRDEHVRLAEALSARDSRKAVEIIEMQIAHSQKETVQALSTMATMPPTGWRTQLGLELRIS